MFRRHAMKGVRFILRAGRESSRRGAGHRGRRAWHVEALEGRALLSVYLVDSLGDAGAGSGSVGDLRYAIEQADQSTGDSAIVFAPSLYGEQIALTQGPLSINKRSGTLAIEGPGADLLAISGGGHSQVFTVSPTSDVIIKGLTITAGIGPQGGGIQNNGTLEVAACTISGNSAMGQGGGGISNGTFGHLTIEGSTISGNESVIGNGGGISNTGTMTIDESTISGNRVVQGNGGGIANTATLTMADDTISDNTATLSGGGIANQAIPSGTISMDNSIVADDSAVNPATDDILDSGDLDGSRLTGSHDLVMAGQTGSLVQTLVGLNPLLGPLRDNGGPTWTEALSPASPAAGAGDTALLPAGTANDQRGIGFGRVVDGRLDLGAYEIQSTRDVYPIVVGSPSPRAPGIVAIVGLTVVPTSPTHPGSGTAGARAGG